MLRLSVEAGHSASSTAERPRLHDVLHHLVTTLTLPHTLNEMLDSLAVLAQQALEVDLCVVLLKDRERDHLGIATSSPALHEEAVDIEPLRVDDALWEELCDYAQRGRILQLSAHEQEVLNLLKNVHYQTLLPVPLIAGSECIGLINCYADRMLDYSDDEQLMLCTIAAQTALAIKNQLCVEEKTRAQKARVSALVNDLISGGLAGESALRRAYHLGYDLTGPHVVALLEVCERQEPHEAGDGMPQRERPVCYESASEQLKQRVQERYPGSLVDERDNLLVCLLRLAHGAEDEQFKSWLTEIARQARDELRLRLSAGIGNLCCAVDDYRRSYAEASQALEVARCLSRMGECSHFDELGAYRYLYKFAQTDNLPDSYQDRIATLVEYDRQKDTNLLGTLEIYLECGGNAARAARHLAIHRNTLLQRLEHIEKLCMLNLEEWQQRLPLLIALKVYRLRAYGG
jgi:sugar diacid utilization regulator